MKPQIKIINISGEYLSGFFNDEFLAHFTSEFILPRAVIWLGDPAKETQWAIV